MSILDLLTFAAKDPAISYTTLSAGRLGAITAALIGLAGVIIGWLTFARPASRLGTSSGALGAAVALAAGLVGIAIGAVVVATSDGGIGTGSGLVGAYVALTVGLTAAGLGAKALTRARRIPARANRPIS